MLHKNQYLKFPDDFNSQNNFAEIKDFFEFSTMFSEDQKVNFTAMDGHWFVWTKFYQKILMQFKQKLYNVHEIASKLTG